MSQKPAPAGFKRGTEVRSKKMKSFLLALQLLTIIPIKIKGNTDERELGRSTAFFPLVGAVQGIILVAANLIFSRFLPTDISSALVLVVLILINGGFHLDGFADTVDGIAGGSTKEERLNIMKDSRVGAIGVVAIVLVLLLKFLAINALAANHSTLTTNSILFILPVIGRWSMVPMAYCSGYARPTGGLGRAFAEYTGIKEFLFATVFALFVSIILLSWNGLIYAGIIFIVVYISTLFFNKKLGGVTGDVFGFQNEMSEVIYLVLAAIKTDGIV
ncbi:MAG: adenosylcobinamide-GDP ribazoletransferase [Deltaproteobacteria bacterium]|nr:adenosylcobinamide-GDP ribazoletransferase [Deltaproteobacteria bacterium]